MKRIGNLNVTGYAFSFNSLTMLSTMPICSTSTVVMLTAKDLLGFRLELVHLLLKQARSKRGVVRARKVARDAAQSARVCELDRVSNIVDLKRRIVANTATSRRRSRSTTPTYSVSCTIVQDTLLCRISSSWTF